MKNKFTFFLITVGLLVTGIGYFLDNRSSNKIENLPFNKLKSIVVSDCGLIGTKNINVKDQDIIKTFSHVLRSARPVDYSSINLRANKGLCELHLIFSDDESHSIIATNTILDGAIISSGDYYYRSDSVMKLIFQVLDTY